MIKVTLCSLLTTGVIPKSLQQVVFLRLIDDGWPYGLRIAIAQFSTMTRKIVQPPKKYSVYAGKLQTNQTISSQAASEEVNV